MPNLPLIWLFIDQIYPKQKDFRPNIWVLFFVLENFRQNIWIVDHSLKGTHLFVWNKNVPRQATFYPFSVHCGDLKFS